MKLRTLLAATVACLAPGVALAENQVEGVVVTGRQLEIQAEVAGRLALSDRETPAAIETLTQVDFQRQGVRTAIEAMNAAPGVASGNIPGSVGAASVRGFYRAVNYLYDGVRMANSDVGIRNWDAWAFERIEVIKGPASVTSGEGALAGAINFVPRRPELGRTGGEVLASYGRFGNTRLAGDLNLPVGETTAVRADLAYSRSSGWIDDTDSRALAGTAAFLWQPTDRLSVTLSADYFEDRLGTAYYGTPLVAAGTARDPSSVISGSAGLVLDKAIRSRNYDTLDGKVKSDATWLRARAEYAVTNDWKIVSDTSWYDADRSYRDSDDYSFNRATSRFDRLTTFISHDHQYWNQRLQASYDGDLGGRRNRFTAGFEIGETDFFTVRRFGTTTSVDPYAPVRGLFPADTPANFSTRQNVTADVKARALFAEDAFNLTPDLLLVAGIRFDDISLDRRVLNATTGAVQTYGQDYNPISWRVGAVYSVRPKTQLYAQFTRAATPVGGLLFLSAANATFDLTTGESYEAGIKHTALEDRLTLTASAYHIRQDKILTRDPANPAVTVQGGSQISKGIEASLDWSVTDEWRVELSGTLLDAEFDKLIEAGGANRSGNRPANVAETLADLVVTYSPEALPLTFSGIVRHSGSFFTSNANTVKADGFTTLDAAVAWDAPFGKVTLRGRNLTDALYADWSGYSSYLVFLGQPRSVEIEFTRKF
ncbi:TonB-dependent receptor [Phenylobacterium sp.]|uniref:TonB-dependent receptor n=1 Tax=Phenylobacterium sp. TaxID=1871053 RepID=UPI003D28382C